MDRVNRVLSKLNLENSDTTSNTTSFENIFNSIEKVNEVLKEDKQESIVNKSKQEYLAKRDVILSKNADDITRDDLIYINSRDIIYQHLPSRYKQAILNREDMDFIYNELGDNIKTLLYDPSIIELQLNQDGFIWIEKYGLGKVKTDITLDVDSASSIIKLVANHNKKTITKESPILSAVLPTGERFEAIIEESVKYLPIFAIRKKPTLTYSLDDLVKNGMLTEYQKNILVDLVHSKKNILIAGGTSSGKTTLTNAMLDVLVDTHDRLLIIEDTPELVCKVENRVELLSNMQADTRDLLRSAMRLTPDRVLVGELRRGDVALELLKLWNSGHDGGISTIHASNKMINIEEDGTQPLKKLEQYLTEVLNGDTKQMIVDSIDVVVYVEKKDNLRKLKGIYLVEGLTQDNKYIIKNIGLEREGEHNDTL